jgi:glycosyltransferase involved in cell wall biosynthesis
VTAPHVSIILCSRDRPADLGRTLASLAAVQVPAALSCELLLVDNGTDDETARVAHEARLPFPLRYVRENIRGKSRALNAALAQARGQVLLCTDDDVRVPPDWVTRMCAPILEGRADAVAGGVVLAAHLQREWMRPYHRIRFGASEDPGPPSLIGANMAFARRVLEQVPAFDPELGPGARGFYDDTLFSLQLAEAGFRIVAEPAATVEHHVDARRLSRGEMLDMARRFAQTRAYVDHHWEHKTVRLLRLRELKARLRLALWRLRHRRHAQAEGLMQGESIRVVGVLYYGFLREELGRPRAYERHGLRRLGH